MLLPAQPADTSPSQLGTPQPAALHPGAPASAQMPPRTATSPRSWTRSAAALRAVGPVGVVPLLVVFPACSECSRLKAYVAAVSRTGSAIVVAVLAFRMPPAWRFLAGTEGGVFGSSRSCGSSCAPSGSTSSP